MLIHGQINLHSGFRIWHTIYSIIGNDGPPGARYTYQLRMMGRSTRAERSARFDITFKKGYDASKGRYNKLFPCPPYSGHIIHGIPMRNFSNQLEIFLEPIHSALIWMSSVFKQRRKGNEKNRTCAKVHHFKLNSHEANSIRYGQPTADACNRYNLAHSIQHHITVDTSYFAFKTNKSILDMQTENFPNIYKLNQASMLIDTAAIGKSFKLWIDRIETSIPLIRIATWNTRAHTRHFSHWLIVPH